MTQEIYVIEHELGPVKIGLAKRPKQRLTNLQVSCPFDLRLKKSRATPDAEEVERFLHRRFRRYHIRGEWFDIPPDEVDFEIPQHIDDSGQPDVAVETSPGRDLDNEWADGLERFFKAFKETRYHTVAIKEIRSQCRELRDVVEDTGEEEPSVIIPPDDLEDTEDIPKGMARCSGCGHYFARTKTGCPTCGTDEFVERST